METRTAARARTIHVRRAVVVPLLLFLALACSTTTSVRHGDIAALADRSPNGSFYDLSSGRANLDVGARPAVGEYLVWRFELVGAAGDSYDCAAVLFSKSYQPGVGGFGWAGVATSCPVWGLRVNGRTEYYDTEGHGHWGWSGSVTVDGVTLNVSPSERRAVASVAR